MPDKLMPLLIKAGVKRDGTELTSDHYLDTNWCRFYEALPQKLGGFKSINLKSLPNTIDVDNDIITGLYILTNQREGTSNNYTDFILYIGTNKRVGYIIIDADGDQKTPFVDRTPTSGKARDELDKLLKRGDIQWDFDIILDIDSTGSADESLYILAFAKTRDAYQTHDDGIIFKAHIYEDKKGPNGYILDNDAFGILGGDMKAHVTGGMAVLYPFLIAYGQNGEVYWSNEDDFEDEGELSKAIIAATDVITIENIRGGTNSPAGLIWTEDSVIRMLYSPSGGKPNFQFDTIAGNTTILSDRTVVECDGSFYWIGLHKFYIYNGMINELQNNMSMEYFFNNINFNYRRRVWGTKLDKYGEIWWFYPSGNNHECDSAIIYNYREKCWFDLKLNRGVGVYHDFFRYPIWSANSTSSVQMSSKNIPIVGGFNLEHPKVAIFLHEYDYDRPSSAGIINASYNASAYKTYSIKNVVGEYDIQRIYSSFTTPWYSWFNRGVDLQNHGLDQFMVINRIEPDFLLEGHDKKITFKIEGKKYNNSMPIELASYDVYDTTLKIDTRVQSRYMRLTISNLDYNGFYQLGRTFLSVNMGDFQ
jgi:hypothetical protein